MPSLRDAFDLLVELPGEERDGRLAALELSTTQRHALRRMLDADAGGTSVMDRPLDAAIDSLRGDDGLAESLVGTTVGSFRIVELIGEGGSSAVFRAERAAGEGSQLVALKMLRVGLFSRGAERRFRREHSILAQLSHPNIARLVEGGVSDAGIPYIAMELVDGEPLTLAANARRLDLRARLAMFAALCRTIDAAHSASIIHRDLKPSNVLVDARGEIKVLDFGIAKLLHAEATTERTQTLALTPEYAAPEQFVAGHQTVAVDVYALGVILGELLTGQRVAGRPLSSAVFQMAATPAGMPARAALAARLRGDLDAIAATATDEQPGRRYRSAAALADDVERWLEGRPVIARAPSRAYRAKKFVSRHRIAVSAAVLVLAALLAGLALALWQAQVARQEARRANAVRDFVVGVFDAARASLPRDLKPTPETLVAQASVRLEAAQGLDGRTRADLDRTLGEVWLSQSSFADAEAAFARALMHATAVGDVAAAETLRVLQADAWQRLGRYEEAVAALEPLLASLRERDAVADYVRALRVLAAAKMALGVREQALALQQEVARQAARLHGSQSVEVLAAELEVGGTLGVMGRYAEAAPVLEATLARWQALGAPEDERYVQGLSNLAVAYDTLGQSADSDARLREVLALRRRIYPAEHETIAKTLRDLAVLAQRRGDKAEAESLFGEALEMQRRVLGPTHLEVAKTLDALGVLLAGQRRFDEAEARAREALAICEATKAREDVCPRARANLGQNYYRQERYAEAESELRAALAGRREIYGDSHPNVAVSMTRLAETLAVLGRAGEAHQLARGSLGILESTGAGKSREAALARAALSRALAAMGERAEALGELERAIADWLRAEPTGKARHATMLTLKADVLNALGRSEESRGTAREAIALGAPESEMLPSTLARLRTLAGTARG